EKPLAPAVQTVPVSCPGCGRLIQLPAEELAFPSIQCGKCLVHFRPADHVAREQPPPAPPVAAAAVLCPCCGGPVRTDPRLAGPPVSCPYCKGPFMSAPPRASPFSISCPLCPRIFRLNRRGMSLQASCLMKTWFIRPTCIGSSSLVQLSSRPFS